jgi:hypothetical protein
LLAVSPGPTQILTAKRLCGKMMNIVKEEWKAYTMNGRKCNGNEHEKSVPTSNYSARILTLPTFSKVQLAIATSFRQWHRLLRDLIVCARCSITNKKTMRVAT